MMKISAFAKVSGISIKTLRYYDELGLLKPAHVDEQSGYRYYSEEQLLTVKRIAAYKEQGFTLEQLQPFFEEDIDTDVVKNKLADKMTELQHAMRTLQLQLDEVNSRMSRLEPSEAGDPAGPIRIREVPSQLAASIRDQVPPSQLCLLLDEITKYAIFYGEPEVSQLIILWHDDGSGNANVADIEIAIPITGDIPANGRVRVDFLPELQSAASLVHRCDPYGYSCPAVPELKAWISSQGLVQSDREPIREIYLTSDKDIYGKKRPAELLIPLQGNAE
ncbi:MerR family transcriptional regulator [Paenibacillus sp. ISL-20]|uniref:MerR family transcriptional regulator n=1 Tax=Paenibacillus sp. ISL-20 TaxID=2819163 RepID=UPI001BE781D0|nr:MerR family transcriptional regulator [Paenibacillus sp. ISL-20]MBT2763637.1 MerR family transcriptional regulator [Paenibacillus sp. ISL-20]